MVIETSTSMDIQIAFGQTTFTTANQLLVMCLFSIMGQFFEATKGKQLSPHLYVRQNILHKPKMHMKPSGFGNF